MTYHFGHVLSDYNTKNLDLLKIRSELVVGDNPEDTALSSAMKHMEQTECIPSLGSKESLDPLLLNFRVLLLEFVGEAEGDDWKSGFILLVPS